MTLKKVEGDGSVVLEDEDACLIIHAAGHLGVFIPQTRPHSDIAKAVMYFAISVQKMGIEPFAAMFDSYEANHPDDGLLEEVTLQ